MLSLSTSTVPLELLDPVFDEDDVVDEVGVDVLAADGDGGAAVEGCVDGDVDGDFEPDGPDMSAGWYLDAQTQSPLWARRTGVCP